MAYYGQGDFYRQGDFFGTLGGIFKGAVKTGLGFLSGGPVGAVTAATSLIPRKTGSGLTLPMAPPMLPKGTTVAPDGTIRRKRRRMNVTNPKALRRANRRVDGFVREVKKSLKHTNYKLVSKGTRSSRKSSPIIVETGPGGVRA